MKLVKEKLASGLYKITDTDAQRVIHPHISLEKMDHFISCVLSRRTPKEKKDASDKSHAYHLAQNKLAKSIKLKK
jgi:hypothetical protein